LLLIPLAAALPLVFAATGRFPARALTTADQAA
jgi:hypothetical protein